MMRRLSLLPCLIAIAVVLSWTSPTASLQTDQLPYRNARLPVDQRVADLLSRMTLEEKIAQTQTMWVTNQLKSLADDNGNFSPDQKTQELLKLGLGQMGGPSQGASEFE